MSAWLRFDAIDVMLATAACVNLAVALVLLVVRLDNGSVAYLAISAVAVLLWVRIWVMCRVSGSRDRT